MLAVKKDEGDRGDGPKMYVVIKFWWGFFFRFGLLIGKYPWWTVGLSLLLCAACSSGIVKWNVVTDPYVLWTPYGSPVRKNNTFPYLRKFFKKTLLFTN